jgi:hypothetical protein
MLHKSYGGRAQKRESTSIMIGDHQVATTVVVVMVMVMVMVLLVWKYGAVIGCGRRGAGRVWS